MEDSKPYGVTMLVTPPTTPPSHLGELTVVAHTSEAGQQRYYKAEEVEALVARLTTASMSVDDAPLQIVHEVLTDWLEENEATDFDENDVAHFFGMLGTAGYSIVPNAALLGKGGQQDA